MNSNVFGWIFVLCAWLLVGHACLQTTQGTYEDHVQIAQAQHRSALLAPRGLSRWLVWYQVQRFGAVPWQFRLGNLGLSAIVIVLVGLLAHELGLSSWIAAGVMALHPLMIETIATISGRAELVAAIGVLGACLCALRGRMALGIGCFSLGLLGKESAIVGLVLVPLTFMVKHPNRVTLESIAIRLGVIAAVCVWYRHIGIMASAPAQSMVTWALLQSGAAMRLITLAIVPHGLTVDYDYDALPRIWFLLSAGSLLALTWTAGRLWRYRPTLGLGLSWVLIVCLPRLIIQTPKSYFNEHQFTLAMVGIALGTAALAQWVEEYGRARLTVA